LAFTKNAKAVKQNVVENVGFKADIAVRKRIQQEATKRIMEGPKFVHQPQNTFLTQMGGGFN
jgi:hypothetical protein